MKVETMKKCYDLKLLGLLFFKKININSPLLTKKTPMKLHYLSLGEKYI